MTTSTPASSLVRGLVALLLVLVLSTEAGQAAAQSPDDAVAKITQLNKDAVTAYQAQKIEDARKLLKQALDLADASGLQQHPITARTHIHMGVVLIALKQRDLGIKQFKKALEIQATINLTKALVTPEMTDAFNEAKGAAPPAAATTHPATTPAATTPPATTPPATTSPATPATPPGNPPSPPPAVPAPTAPPPVNPEPTEPAEPGEAPAASPEEPSSAIIHQPIASGKKGSAISVTVTLEADLKFDKIVLAYRPEGATDFLGREMKELAEGRYGAEIPTTATLGETVDYYVEADDADGNAVATKGTVESPLVINLGGAKAAVHKEEGEEEEDDEPDHKYFVGLMLGSGFGYATGPGDLNRNVSISPPGIAPATLLQVAPEFGYWLTSKLMLSLQLRYQYVTGTVELVDPSNSQVHKPANYAFAVFAKATWELGDDEGSWHPFFSLAAGGGYIRHVVTLHPTQSPKLCGAKGDQACVDTIQGGPILVGPGGGVFYDLTDNISLVGQANTVIGFWDNFTFNVDLNIGVAVGF
jgi:hypothetical protein